MSITASSPVNLSDPDLARSRQFAMDEARRRLQEKHDAEAAIYAEKQKEVSGVSGQLLISCAMY